MELLERDFYYDVIHGALGLLGNVRQWVTDWSSAQYDWTFHSGVRTPISPSSGEDRVVQGGDSGADSYPHSNDCDILETTSVNLLGFHRGVTPRNMSC